MKELFNEAILELVLFSGADIITTSGGGESDLDVEQPLQ